MRFTNRSNLPSHLADVLKAAYLNDAYDGPKGDRAISVTQLIAPAQKLKLERENADKLEMDVMDTVPALMGQALHHVLERAGENTPALVPEKRLSTSYDGWLISGKTDLYETKDAELTDYKTSSVWAFVFGKIEWEQQLNVYRWLMDRNGISVRSLSVTLFCTDWRRGEAKRSEDYPARVVRMPIKLWTLDEAGAFVDARLAFHRAASDGNVPECSPEERWAKPTKYAVMKPGRKTALAVYDTPVDATPGTTIEVRPGESVRCNGYCLGAPYCRQWAKDPTNPAVTRETEE